MDITISRIGLFIAIVSMISVNGFAQEISNTDSVKTKRVYEDKKPHQDMLLIDLTWEHLLNMPGDVRQKWYGRGVNIGLLYDYPLNRNGNVSVAIGGGFHSHNYYTNALAVTYDSAGQGWSEWLVPGNNVKSRGKISANYIDIPIEIRFRSNENRYEERWKLAVGGKVGYLIDVHEKIFDGDDRKYKLYDYPHVSLFRYGVNARVGYGNVMLSAFYSFTPFFESKYSLSDQNALSIGISIVPF